MNYQHILFKNPHGWVTAVAASVLITACGGGGGGNGTEPTPVSPPVVAVATIALFAGNLDGRGNIDWIGVAARFDRPGYIATDSGGNVYVSDPDNHTIRKITSAGAMSTLAGNPGVAGNADGNGAAASFKNPNGIATDSAHNVYVADAGNATIRKITPAGLVSTLAGTAGVFGNADGSGAAASFGVLTGIATDSAGNVYAIDSLNATIRKITSAGLVSTLAGRARVFGHADGSGAAASFSTPIGIATDSAGNVYVAETGPDNSLFDDRLGNLIRKITPAGVVSTLAGTAGVYGSADGNGTAARFNYPSAIATDGAGNVYVADRSNHTIRKITPAGLVSTLAGTAGVIGYTNASKAAASFNNPSGIATDTAGNVYVADRLNHAIRKVTPDGLVGTLDGTAGVFGDAGQSGETGRFYSPGGIATDSAGNVYVPDWFSNTIRKITSAGVASTLAGTAGVFGNVDGSGAAASFYRPRNVATDSADNVYVVDASHAIRKITPAGVVSTLAGMAGVSGSADGIGAAARFNIPIGIATDRSGNVYVADGYNNTIRKITPAGLVSTLAGTAGVFGYADGIGAAASFKTPGGIATDGAGNVYVADFYNNAIRKITPTGVVSTLAGVAGAPGFTDGIGAAARFTNPSVIATDGMGNVYVNDAIYTVIRKITPTGVVSTLAGAPGRIGFTAGALPGVLAFPLAGLAVSKTSLYVAMSTGVAVITNLP